MRQTSDHRRLLVTGGAGFIGANLVQLLLRGATVDRLVNLDKLTYASCPEVLAPLEAHPAYRFVAGDICDADLLRQLLADERPDAVLHLAAETHVDRSITDAKPFVLTNVLGTQTLLESCRRYHATLTPSEQEAFRVLFVSTDEVYGSLGESGFFSESSPYAPSSPYAATKAAADHLVRAYRVTHGLPVLLTHCANNYGPYQFPEKLIPLMITRALAEQPLPVYGQGNNIRDWLYVEDHCHALCAVLERGQVGRTYDIGGDAPQTNLAVVETVCTVLNERRPRPSGRSYRELIQFVTDRPGHDYRYATDSSRIRQELGWRPVCSFAQGISRTVNWYLERPA